MSTHRERLIVKIPRGSTTTDHSGETSINGTAILLYAYPPTKKDPLRRKLALRLATYVEITDAGRKFLTSKEYGRHYYFNFELEAAAKAPDGILYYPMGRLIPINDNTIDELMDGLITAKEFLAGISGGITNERPAK